VTVHPAGTVEDQRRGRDRGLYRCAGIQDVLDVVQPGTADFNTGTGRIPVAPQEQSKITGKYSAYLRRIDKALETWEPERARKDSRSPQALRCQCTVDTIMAGMAKRGIPVTDTPAAPNLISASKGVRERGGIVCADCGAEFA
jgi:hypothetical protein